MDKLCPYVMYQNKHDIFISINFYSIFIYSKTFLFQIHELEVELDAEGRRERDAVAENKKLVKLLNDLRAQANEDQRLVSEYSDTINILQTRISKFKTQLAESVSEPRHRLLVWDVSLITDISQRSSLVFLTTRWEIIIK